jgi:hypothetical protein
MYLTTDASAEGIGAWIEQIGKDKNLISIIYTSKKLNVTQQRWLNTKKELCALVWKLKRFRHYLLGRHFIARVDHKSFVSLIKNKMIILTEEWIETIIEYNFSTEYLPGIENNLADV